MVDFLLALRPAIRYMYLPKPCGPRCTACPPELYIEAIVQLGGISTNETLIIRRVVGGKQCVAEMICAIGTRIIATHGRDAPLITPERRTQLLRTLDLRLFGYFSVRAAEICFALEGLRFPALVTIEILDSACVFALDIPYHFKWALVTKIKHFVRQERA